MAVFQHSVVQAAAGTPAADPVVERGLWFNAADTHRLDFTPSTDGDRTKGTWSFWVKRLDISSTSDQGILGFPDGGYMIFTGADLSLIHI